MKNNQTFTPVETLQSALAYLMSRYSMITSLQLQGCPSCSALSIAQHLELLHEHPKLKSSILRGTYRSLASDWRGLAEHHERQSVAKHQNSHTQTVQIH